MKTVKLKNLLALLLALLLMLALLPSALAEDAPDAAAEEESAAPAEESGEETAEAKVKKRKKFSDTHYIAYTAIFATMAAVLMLLEIPLFFAPGFYKLDLSELPIMICTFYLGPVSGVVAEFIKVLLKLLLKGTRQRLQRFVSDPEIRTAFPHGAGKDRRHGYKRQQEHYQRLYPGALCGGALQSGQGRDRFCADLPAV